MAKIEKMKKLLCFLGMHKDFLYYTTLNRTNPKRIKICKNCQKIIF